MTTPAKIDTAIAEAGAHVANAITRFERAKASTYLGRPRFGDEALKLAESLMIDAHSALNAVTALYDGWTRWYLVTSSDNGHIHKSMACSTCFATTEFAMLPAVSGATAAEVVAKFGEAVCTTCVPEAPTMTGWKSSDLARWDAAVRRAEDEERDAARRKAEAESFTVTWDGRTKKFKSERALSNAVSSELHNIAFYGGVHPSNAEWTANVSAAAELIDIGPIVERVAKKVRKEGRDYAKAYETAAYPEHMTAPAERIAELEAGIAAIEALAPAGVA